jgi:RimJ/RimL family protein N-acetyltransferase
MIETARLVLRGWRDEDRAPFAEMGRSPAVMRYLGAPMTDVQAAEAIARQRAFQAELGHCFWAIERKADAAFLGFCGLKPGTVGPIAGAIEIGWRLREDAWGQGYAREAALASLDWGWAHLPATSIHAITVPANTASWGLMERIGMVRRPDMDFGHPLFEDDHPLHRHISYEARRPAIPR